VFRCDTRSVGIFFFLIIAGAMFAVSHLYRQNTRAGWARVAGQLGLYLEPGSMFRSPQISGELRGIPVRVETVTRGHSNNRSTATVYTTAHHSPSPLARFARQSNFSFPRSFVGRADVVVGDPRFDSRIIVDSDYPEAVTEFLTPARRATIHTISRLVDTSRILEAPDAVDHALATREAGDLAAASPDARPALDAKKMIDDLLGPRRLGHEVEVAFEQGYQGRTVEWSGEVDSARDFRSDADFGSEPGTKVVVRIGSIGESDLFSNLVKAVVEFAPDTDLARGNGIRFTGTLLRIDRFTRSIYIADAALATWGRPADAGPLQSHQNEESQVGKATTWDYSGWR
jgi:hypothetical protein